MTATIGKINEKIAQYKTQIQSNDTNAGQTLDEIKKLMAELEKYKK